MDSESMKRRAKIKARMQINKAQRHLQNLADWLYIETQKDLSDKRLAEVTSKFERLRMKHQKAVDDAKMFLRAIHYDSASR